MACRSDYRIALTDLSVGAARWTVAANFQISAARRTEIRTRNIRRAARAAATRQWRNIAARFARDVIFDYLPRVFSKFVLPVSAECRQRKQRWKDDGADSSHGGFVEPLLHSDLYTRAAGLRCDLDRERRGETGQIS